MKNKGLRLVAIIAVTFCMINIETYGQDSDGIYYQSESTLIKLSPDTSTSEVIVTDIQSTLIFSVSGEYAAFQNLQGVWLSKVSEWQPQLLTDIPTTQGFSLFWTPDDTRLILRIWNINNEQLDTRETVAYNLLSKEMERWEWGECNRIARYIESGNFAMICDSYSGIENPRMQTIALLWGGDYQEYVAEQYTIILDGREDLYPYPIYFDWASTRTNEDIVYIKRNPDYQSDSDLYSFWEIFTQSTSTDESSLHSLRYPSVARLLSVSPDRKHVAYKMNCGANNLQECLQVADLDSKEIIWDATETIELDSIFDIDWTLDSSKVVVLGLAVDELTNHSIYVMDISTGEISEFNVGRTTGAIAIQ